MRNNKKGQALIEFVLILPIILLLTFGVIDFGRIIYSKTKLESTISDAVSLYLDNRDLETISKKLDLDNDKIILEKDGTKLILIEKIQLLTPGLGQLLDNPYTVKVEKVIYNE